MKKINLLIVFTPNGGDNLEQNYKCPKCGHNEVYTKPNGRRIGVYCSDCDSWICWITYSKMIELYKSKQYKLSDKVAFRKIFKRNGTTTMRCSNCDCLLYNSCKPRPQGQFNLVNAKACPNCERKLI